TPSVSTVALIIAYDPKVPGSDTATLEIQSDSAGGVIDIPLIGTAIPATAAISVQVPNNNAGGQILGGTSQARQFGTITNNGSQDLRLTGVQPSTGFTVTGLPANLSFGSPLVLKPGQSASFGLSFTPDKAGLIRGTVQFTSNDPNQPILRATVVGTG